MAGSFSFNGSSQYLTVPSSSAFAFGTGNLTIESWCYFANGSGVVNQVICSNYGPSTAWSTDSFYFGKHVSASGKVTFWLNNFSNSTPLLTDPNLPPTNTWVHYAVTRSTNTWTLWRNGVSVATGTYTGNPNATKNSIIIGEADINSNYFSGYLSNLRIVKGTAVYTTTFTPSQSILPNITNTSLLLNVIDSTNFIKDNSSNNFTVTNNGTATFNANGPFNQGSTTTKQRQINDGTLEVYTQFDEFTGAPVVDSSLVLWLDAGQTASYSGSGATWTNLISNGISGTLTNSPTFSSSNGGFFVFNGTNQYVGLGSSNAITGDNQTAFTLEVWVNYTSTTPDRLIHIQRGSGGLNSALLSMVINVNQTITTTGYLQFVTRNSTNTNVEYLVSNGNYNLVGKFQNFVATITGTSRALYVNGVLVASDTVTGLPSVTGNTDPANLAVQPGLTNFFNGSMAVAKVYRRALTADEVTTNFNALRNRYGV